MKLRVFREPTVLHPGRCSLAAKDFHALARQPDCIDAAAHLLCHGPDAQTAQIKSADSRMVNSQESPEQLHTVEFQNDHETISNTDRLSALALVAAAVATLLSIRM